MACKFLVFALYVLLASCILAPIILMVIIISCGMGEMLAINRYRIINRHADHQWQDLTLSLSKLVVEEGNTRPKSKTAVVGRAVVRVSLENMCIFLEYRNLLHKRKVLIRKCVVSGGT